MPFGTKMIDGREMTIDITLLRVIQKENDGASN